MKILLIIMLFSHSLLADTKCALSEAEPSPLNSLLKQISIINDKVSIPAEAGGTKHVINKRCNEKVPTIQEAESFIMKQGADKPKTPEATLSSINFKNESPDLISAFSRLTRKNLGFNKMAPPEDLQAKYQINPDCNKVLCAIKKIFGDELGAKLLYINLKYNFNGSELAFTDADRFKVPEIDNLIQAMNSFPKDTFPIKKNKRLTHHTRTRASGEVANATMVFTDIWSKKNPERRQVIAFHEMAHSIATAAGLDRDPAWIGISDWHQVELKEKVINGKTFKARTVWRFKNPGTVPSIYARDKGPYEDFAESAVTYRYNPELLKKISPEKYRFFKETIFHGLEYNTDEECAPEKSFVQRIAKSLPSPQATSSKDEYYELIKSCPDEVRHHLLGKKDSKKNLKTCLSLAHVHQKLQAAITSLTPAIKYQEQAKRSLAIKRVLPQILKDYTYPDKKLREYLKQEMLSCISKVNRSILRDGESKPRTSEHYCKIFASRGSYKHIPCDPKLKEMINLYSERKELEAKLSSLCKKAHQGKSTETIFTKEQIANEFEYLD